MSRRRAFVIAICLGIIVTSAIVYLGLSDRGGDSGGRVPLDPQQVSEGKAVYESKCISCHGPEGRGAPDWREPNPDKTYPPPPHDSSGHTWHHGDGLLFRIVKEGGKMNEDPGFKSAMPAYGSQLDATEIEAVIGYFKSLWGPEERSSQAEASAIDPFPKSAGR